MSALKTPISFCTCSEHAGGVGVNTNATDLSLHALDERRPSSTERIEHKLSRLHLELVDEFGYNSIRKPENDPIPVVDFSVQESLGLGSSRGRRRGNGDDDVTDGWNGRAEGRLLTEMRHAELMGAAQLRRGEGSLPSGEAVAGSKSDQMSGGALEGLDSEVKA